MDLLNSTRTAANIITDTAVTPEEKPAPKYGERLLDFYVKKSDSWADEFKDPERLAQHAYAKASDNNVMDYDFEDAKQNTTQYVDYLMAALEAAGENTSDTTRFQTS